MREAERDMLVHMAQEVGQNLKQMEDVLDAFFRDAAMREGLAALPGLAQQAQGALTMLEQTGAARLLGCATELAGQFAQDGTPDEATQQRLADAFSSLGLFIEACCAGRADADRMLRPALIDFGIAEAETDVDPFGDTVESGLAARKSGVHANYAAWRDAEGDAGAKKKFIDALTELARDAELIDDDALKTGAREALDAAASADTAPAALDARIVQLTGLPLAERTAAPATVESDTENFIFIAPAPDAPEHTTVFESAVPGAPDRLPAEADADDETAEPQPVGTAHTLRVSQPEDSLPELLEIFLEEANEVLAALGEAVETCRARPEDRGALAVIRRGFHTLKGSGRMVHLDDLGEAAWQHEQLLNGWLADDRPASAELLELIARARGVFQAWVDALQAGTETQLPVPALLAAASRVANGLPLDLPECPSPSLEATSTPPTVEAETITVGTPAGLVPTVADCAPDALDERPLAADIETFGTRVEFARLVFRAVIEIASPPTPPTPPMPEPVAAREPGPAPVPQFFAVVEVAQPAPILPDELFDEIADEMPDAAPVAPGAACRSAPPPRTP